jgi:Mg-chelatase subunit ChlD
MNRLACVLLGLLGLAFTLSAQDDAGGDIVFRSDVSLIRVDAQVLDRQMRAVTGLSAGDFVLRDEGVERPIRNFVREEMPVDVLMLFDVSRSMRPHVETVAGAARDAFRILGNQDRVAIMVFDRATRVRMGFSSDREQIFARLDKMLRDEHFSGGTDITRAIVDAAGYIGREGRRDGRRAIVILTDDQTERNRDVEASSRALIRADAVMSALIAPDAMGRWSAPPAPRDPGVWGPGGGGWPGGIGRGPWGGVIIGGRRRPGGGGYPTGGGRMPAGGGHTQSAKTAEIAEMSGGDSITIDDAAALNRTLSRIRERYAIYYYLPDGANPGRDRTITLALTDQARRRHPGSEVRHRRVYSATDVPMLASGGSSRPSPVSEPEAALTAERPASSQGGGWRTATPEERQDASGLIVRSKTEGSSASTNPAKPATTGATESPEAASSAGNASEEKPKRGWRRVDEPSGVPGPAVARPPEP